LEDNEGDVDLTTDQLVSLVTKKEEEQRKSSKQMKRIQQEREMIIEILVNRFDNLTKSEILSIVERHRWNVKTASTDLLKQSEQKKKEQIAQLFKSFSEEQIEKTLQENNWQIVDSTKKLEEIRKQKIVELEKKKLEEEQKVVGKEKDTTKIHNFMERSIRLGEELEDEINKANYDLDPEQVFKKDLESKLRFSPNDLPGLPGIVPLSRKIVDEMREKKQKEIEEKEKEMAHKSAPVQRSPQEVSSHVNVEDKIQMVLSVHPDRIDCGHKFKVTWTIESNYTPTPNDWVALYRAEENNSKSYLCYEWNLSSEKKGSLVFTAPLLVGRYKFYYLSNKSYEILSMSNIFSVGPHYDMIATLFVDEKSGNKNVKVNVDQRFGTSQPNAWVGLFEPNQSNNSQYVTYQWMIDAVNNTLLFVVPKSGNWEFRLFLDRNYWGTYVDVKRCLILVPGEDTLELSIVDNQAIVRYMIETVDPYKDSAWIGLFFVDEKNNRQWRRYKNIYLGGSNEIRFKAPQSPGTYHARLFANRYSLLQTSNLITIPSKV